MGILFESEEEKRSFIFYLKDVQAQLSANAAKAAELREAAQKALDQELVAQMAETIDLD